MSVLSRRLIIERLKMLVTRAESLVVTPFDESSLDADSIDLRLGSHFLIPRYHSSQPAIDIENRATRSSDLRVHVPHGGSLVLPAHQTVLGVTLEFIKMPFDVSGQILTKSSIARTFMVIETAPWIHPMYRGCLTLEIANVSNSALILHPGMRIGQLIFLAVQSPEDTKVLSGSYIGPIHPEPPLKLKRHAHS
jgi:dCTP deaminase